MPFKGLSQQVKNTWKLYQSKAVDQDMLLQIFKKKLNPPFNSYWAFRHFLSIPKTFKFSFLQELEWCLQQIYSNLLLLGGPSLAHLFSSKGFQQQMSSISNVGLSRWSWNATSVHSCHWILSNVTLSVFQLYSEHHIYFCNVTSVTWDTFSVIWNASIVNTIHVPIKRRI